MDDLDKEMKMSFIDEGRQLLEAAEQCFLDLEATGGGPVVIETLFRLAHNMKGTSRAVGFGEVATFTHELENLLLRLKDGKLSIDKSMVDLLLACNDHLKTMVEGLALDMEASFDSTELIARIKAKIDGAAAPATSSPEPAAPVASAPASAPAAAPGVTPAAAAPTLAAEPAPTPAASYQPDRQLAIDEEEEDSSPALPSLAEMAAGGATAVTASVGGGGIRQSNSVPVDESIRVSLARLEKLSDFIGELVILQTVLNQHRSEIESQLVQRTVQQLGKLSKEIQDISMSLRMIPLKQTFAKLQRIVRDTARVLDKEVELSVYGDQTEVDKTVLEHISDPLIHIVRNAIDHGLETKADRTKVGKPEEGRLMIRAFHKGNNLVIEVTDDGRGIDPKKLMKKAIERGIVNAKATLSDADAIQLIFHPGFTTKDQASEISGRGVGLDVVRTNVERVGGQVQLESDVGFGSCFRIILPLTLAIIDGLVVRAGGERYVIPISTVYETVQPRKEDVNFVTGKGEMLNLRDQVLPLFRLTHLLRTNAGRAERESWRSIAIIVNSRKAPFAVLVDDIVRQQQIVIKKLGPEIRVQKGLAGSAILGDGKPALILDLNDLLELVASSPVKPPRAQPAA